MPIYFKKFFVDCKNSTFSGLLYTSCEFLLTFFSTKRVADPFGNPIRKRYNRFLFILQLSLLDADEVDSVTDWQYDVLYPLVLDNQAVEVDDGLRLLVATCNRLNDLAIP